MQAPKHFLSSSDDEKTRRSSKQRAATLPSLAALQAASSSGSGDSAYAATKYASAPLPSTKSALTETESYFLQHVEDSTPAAFSAWSSYLSGDLRLPSLQRRRKSGAGGKASLNDDDLEGDEEEPLLSSPSYGTLQEGPKSAELVMEKVSGKLTPVQAASSIIKAVIGAGSFALPWGFMQAGLLGGLLGMALLSFLSLFTILMLIQCKNSIPELKRRYVTYVDLVRVVLGKPLAIVLYAAIIITSLGACAAYLVFCGGMLYTVSEEALEGKYWVLILAGPLIAFVCIRSFRYLAFTSIIGDIALALGMLAMFIEGFRSEKLLPNPTDYAAFRIDTFPLFFGTAAFLFCIHMLVIPVEQSMKNPAHFKWTAIISFIIVTLINMIFAAIGYMLFKDHTDSIVINNLQNNAFVSVARIMLVIDLFFTYLVVIVPARDIVETSLLKEKPAKKTNTDNFGEDDDDEDYEEVRPVPVTFKQKVVVWFKDNWRGLARNVIRTVMVGITVLIATTITQFSDLIGLVSGLALSAMAFILPPLLHLKLNWKGWRRIGFMTVVNVLIIVFGLVAGVTTTFESVKSIVKNGIQF
ncbi:Transmembrane amino acid transporter protein [Balamuthia mandrillaris]